MAGIDIDIIQSNVLNKRTAMQKISSLLLNKVAENERLIKFPLEILLGELPTDGTCPEPTRLQNILNKRNNIVGFLNRFNHFFLSSLQISKLSIYKSSIHLKYIDEFNF